MLSPDGAGGVRTAHYTVVAGVDLGETPDGDYVNSPVSDVPENGVAVRPLNDLEVARVAEDLRTAEAPPDLVRGSRAGQARIVSLRDVLHEYWEWYEVWGIRPPAELYSPDTGDARVASAFGRHREAVRAVLKGDGTLPDEYRGRRKGKFCEALADFERSTYGVEIDPDSVQSYLRDHVWKERKDWEVALEEWAAVGKTGV